MHQHTLRAACHIYGKGIHTGADTQITLLPAPPDTGVVFRLLRDGREQEFPALAEYVTSTTLSTTLGMDGMEVCTVEHLLSALAGLEVDNVYVVATGPEIPVMDGSSQPFVTRIMEVGRRLQPVPRKYIKILEPVVVVEGDRSAGLFPAMTTSYAFRIDFDNPAIQTQSLKVRLTPHTYVAQLAKARTFGFLEDLQKLQAKGLAMGAGLHNAVALDTKGNVHNAEGLRYADEFVRHKLLDAIGDLSLAGYPIIGEYRGDKSGHQLNHQLVKALAEHPENWEIVSTGIETAAQAV